MNYFVFFDKKDNKSNLLIFPNKQFERKQKSIRKCLLGLSNIEILEQPRHCTIENPKQREPAECHGSRE